MTNPEKDFLRQAVKLGYSIAEQQYQERFFKRTGVIKKLSRDEIDNRLRQAGLLIEDKEND